MKNPARVLIVGFEATPFFKTGGLGDVMHALPKALRGIGVDARVVIPYYASLKKELPQKKIGEMYIRFGKELRSVKMYEGVFPDSDTPIYFLENQRYINLEVTKIRSLEPFVFFDIAVSYFTNWLSMQNIWQPAIIHCNDWHTALIPLLLKSKLQSSIRTLLTIHNLLYQGSASYHVLDLLNLKDEETKGIKHNQPVSQMNILGEGILHATRVSTVSPTYADEISKGRHLELIYAYLQKRKEEKSPDGKVVGILNGIDYEEWDPCHDKVLKQKYGFSDLASGKAKNKQALLKQLNLPDKPTFAFVGRMANQKGLDLLSNKIDDIMKLDLNIILLGTGQPDIEESMRQIARKYKDRFRAEIHYEEEFAHELYAGSDFLLIPSHYEPCGLIQMIAMRYGTVPIAAKTGGLADSIKDGKTGFLFEKDSSSGLLSAIKRALSVYEKKDSFEAMRTSGMKEDFSWDKSAKRYRDLYIDILKLNE